MTADGLVHSESRQVTSWAARASRGSLIAEDLVDEYRVMIEPIVCRRQCATGRRVDL